MNFHGLCSSQRPLLQIVCLGKRCKRGADRARSTTRRRDRVKLFRRSVQHDVADGVGKLRVGRRERRCGNARLAISESGCRDTEARAILARRPSRASFALVALGACSPRFAFSPSRTRDTLSTRCAFEPRESEGKRRRGRRAALAYRDLGRADGGVNSGRSGNRRRSARFTLSALCTSVALGTLSTGGAPCAPV